jgi:hypothetical protein
LISRELSLRFGFGVLPIFALVFLVLTIIYGLQKRRSLRV